MTILHCPACSATHKPERARWLCHCGSVLDVEYEKLQWKPKGRGVWKYRTLLPFAGKSITLDEGGTPLVKSERLGLKHLYLKLEGDNPTDSFKDRGTTVAISRAKAEGYKTVAVASTGNMGASVAAYAAHAGLKARVFVPQDTPKEKLAQILAYGARVKKVKGTFKDAVAAAWRDVEKNGSYLAMTGLNPFYNEGEKTVAYEIFEQLGAPDVVIVPMGTGGLISSIWKGFVELKKMKKIRKIPRMIGVQAKGCAPIVDAWRRGAAFATPKEKCETIASAILVKLPFSSRLALRAIRESGGVGIAVSDKEIIRAIRELGREGVFAEPASAATLAALHHVKPQQRQKIILVITGHGLKQPGAALA
jgi:threonine synthase